MRLLINGADQGVIARMPRSRVVRPAAGAYMTNRAMRLVQCQLVDDFPRNGFSAATPVRPFSRAAGHASTTVGLNFEEENTVLRSTSGSTCIAAVNWSFGRDTPAAAEGVAWSFRITDDRPSNEACIFGAVVSDVLPPPSWDYSSTVEDRKPGFFYRAYNGQLYSKMAHRVPGMNTAAVAHPGDTISFVWSRARGDVTLYINFASQGVVFRNVNAAMTRMWPAAGTYLSGRALKVVQVEQLASLADFPPRAPAAAAAAAGGGGAAAGGPALGGAAGGAGSAIATAPAAAAAAAPGGRVWPATGIIATPGSGGAGRSFIPPAPVLSAPGSAAAAPHAWARDLSGPADMLEFEEDGVLVNTLPRCAQAVAMTRVAILGRNALPPASARGLTLLRGKTIVTFKIAADTDIAMRSAVGFSFEAGPLPPYNWLTGALPIVLYRCASGGIFCPSGTGPESPHGRYIVDPGHQRHRCRRFDLVTFHVDPDADVGGGAAGTVVLFINGICEGTVLRGWARTLPALFPLACFDSGGRSVRLSAIHAVEAFPVYEGNEANPAFTNRL